MMILIGIEQGAQTFNDMHIAFGAATRWNAGKPQNSIAPMM